MDPQLALYSFLAALQDDDRETADEYHVHLKEWLARGGFPPDWDDVEREKFLNYR